MNLVKKIYNVKKMPKKKKQWAGPASLSLFFYNILSILYFLLIKKNMIKDKSLVTI
jgi:hypothetical protein